MYKELFVIDLVAFSAITVTKGMIRKILGILCVTLAVAGILVYRTGGFGV